MTKSRWQKEHVTYRGLPKGWFSKRVVLADVPPERKPERGYIRMFPQNVNRNGGTFACSPGTKTGTRVHSPKPPLITKPPFRGNRSIYLHASGPLLGNGLDRRKKKVAMLDMVFLVFYSIFISTVGVDIESEFVSEDFLFLLSGWWC